MGGRHVTASAGGPTSNSTTGSASWTDNPDEVRQNLVGYGTRIGAGEQLHLSSYSYAEPLGDTGTVTGRTIKDSTLFVQTTSGERWGEGNQFGYTDGVRLVTDPSSGYVVHPQFYASRLVEYTQVNNVFGGGRQIGIKVDILINVDGPSLKYQTAQEYSSSLNITKLTGSANE